MNRHWAQNSATPGSVRPVYGAAYPPLRRSAVQEEEEREMPTTSRTAITEPPKRNNFEKYEASVSDAWDVADVSLDSRAASVSAARVLATHSAASRGSSDNVMPNVHPLPSRNSRVQAMQRLATQRDPIPGSAIPTGGGGQALYPRLSDPSAAPVEQRSSPGRKSPSPQRFRGKRLGSQSSVVRKISPDTSQLSRSAGDGDHPLTSSLSMGTGREKDLVRFDRLRLMLGAVTAQQNAQQPDVDVEQLRKDCWMGVPHMLRPQAWRLLSGYLPTNIERREATMTRKRNEYWHYVEQYFHTRHEDQHQDTFRQIHIDIPRMCPLIPLFQQKMVQEMFERILYIWAIRHPASGYVQGINDLVTPFFVVFLSEFVRDDTEVGTFDVSQLAREHLEVVEADSFWCVSALLDTIQDNYTFAQPGIQRKVLQLRHLVSRVDNQLHQHLEAHNVEYLQFAFRWMNNLLMREIPLRATIRLWDTYLSERNGFSQFHGYVCAAFLRMWSKQLQQEKDFQSIMILLQNLPTQNWGDQHICELTADAFSLMALFAGAKNHLQSANSQG